MDVRFHRSLAAAAKYALSLPEAWADEPWGDPVVKVGKKIFVFISSSASTDPVITVKVPESREHALSFPGSTPTGYGLGKHGWVTISVDHVPDTERDILLDFVDESYRAVATKTLAKLLDARRLANET
jgi:predicted DNA-binding protein (MmcQ/YjbR family)